MKSRDLVYAVYEDGFYDRLPLHFESIKKNHEAKLGDVLLGHGWVSLWEDWFYSGGPFRRREGERLLEWVERLDVETDYSWPSESDVVDSCVKGFKENVEPFYRKNLFIVFEVVGPTEYSEYSMMPPRPESGYKYDLAYHNLDFSKLLLLNRKKAIKLYDKLAKYILEVIKYARELDIVDAVRIADDAFTYSSPIYPTWFMDNCYLKWHRIFVNAVKAKGKKAILHCDGDVTKLGYIRKLAEIYDGIHPLDLCSKSTVEAALNWVNRVSKARRDIGWKAVFHTGISIDLVLNDSIDVKDFVKVVKKMLDKHGPRKIVLSVTHRPYPKRSFGEKLALAKVNAVRKLVGLPEVSL
ncbi:MAG: hypothetical protein DRO23_01605 [Thermoprotei archaeon]|nr:MAG: hypothetical protein DRO23_01605 [Thermoprotei archaeon]